MSGFAILQRPDELLQSLDHPETVDQSGGCCQIRYAQIDPENNAWWVFMVMCLCFQLPRRSIQWMLVKLASRTVDQSGGYCLIRYVHIDLLRVKQHWSKYHDNTSGFSISRRSNEQLWSDQVETKCDRRTDSDHADRQRRHHHLQFASP